MFFFCPWYFFHMHTLPYPRRYIGRFALSTSLIRSVYFWTFYFVEKCTNKLNLFLVFVQQIHIPWAWYDRTNTRIESLAGNCNVLKRYWTRQVADGIKKIIGVMNILLTRNNLFIHFLFVENKSYYQIQCVRKSKHSLNHSLCDFTRNRKPQLFISQ